MRSVHVTTFAMEKEQHIRQVLFGYMSLATIQKYRGLHNSILWLIYVAGKNKTDVALRVKCPMLQCNTGMSVHGLLQPHNLPKRIAIAGKSLHRYSVLASVGVKHLRLQTELINFEAASTKYSECVSVFLPQLPGKQKKNHIFFRHIILPSVSCLAVQYFFHVIS